MLSKSLNIVPFTSFLFPFTCGCFFTIKSCNQALSIYFIQVFLFFFIPFYLFELFLQRASCFVLEPLDAKFFSSSKLLLCSKSNSNLFPFLFQNHVLFLFVSAFVSIFILPVLPVLQVLSLLLLIQDYSILKQ